MAAGNFLYVLSASYENALDAYADFETVRDLYDRINALTEFDAAVLVKNEKGSVRIDRSYEAGGQYGSLKGLGWGMAAGTATAVFPAVGVRAAIAAGNGSGAAIGAIAGHVRTGMHRRELEALSDFLVQGQAALIVVCRTNLADLVSASITSENRCVGQVVDATVDQIAEDIREAEEPRAKYEVPFRESAAVRSHGQLLEHLDV